MQAQGNGTYVLNNNWPAYSGYALDTDTTSDITNADVFQTGAISSWNSFRMVKNSDGTYRIMSTYGGLYRALNAEMNDINAGKTPINCIFYPYDGTGNEKWTLEPAFGCAWGFNDKGTAYSDQVNCYAYALGLNKTPSLYMLDWFGTGSKDNVMTVANRVTSYVNSHYTGSYKWSIRIISGPTSPINSNEYRMCLRVGNHPECRNDTWNINSDYHF